MNNKNNVIQKLMMVIQLIIRIKMIRKFDSSIEVNT